jgi:RNase H-like protein
LWARLDRAAQPHIVTYEWVKGHNGDSEQEAADKIARTTAELGRINEVMLTEVAKRLENEDLTSTVPRDRTQLRNYLFLDTMEHGYFLVTPKELQAVLLLDQETGIPRHSDTRPLTTADKGQRWQSMDPLRRGLPSPGIHRISCRCGSGFSSPDS